MLVGNFASIFLVALFVVAMVTDVRAAHPLLKKIARAVKIGGITEQQAVAPQENHHLRAVHAQGGGNGTTPRFLQGVLRLTFFNGGNSSCDPSDFLGAELFELNKCFNSGNGSMKFRAWKTHNNNLGFTIDHHGGPNCAGGNFSKEDNYFPYETCVSNRMYVALEPMMPLLPPPEVGPVAVISGYRDNSTCEASFNLPIKAGHVQLIKIGACQSGDNSEPDMKVADCSNGLQLATYPSQDGSCSGNLTTNAWNAGGPNCIGQDITGKDLSPILSSYVCVQY